MGPAENADNQIQLLPETINMLKSKFDSTSNSAFDSDILTAASVFCMMESVQMSDTFQIQPPDGYQYPKEVHQETVQALLATAKQTVIDHFQGMADVARKGKDESHLPTANNPFVLGYAIRQQPPQLKEVNPHADPARTPPYFLPRKVDCTTTASPGNKFTDGTLNFCMLTHSWHDGYRIESMDVSTVKFPETFFQKLSVRGGIKETEAGNYQGGHDGIMAFSHHIFCDLWLAEAVAQPFVADISNYGNAIRPPHPNVKERKESGESRPSNYTTALEAVRGIEYTGSATAMFKDNLGAKRNYDGNILLRMTEVLQLSGIQVSAGSTRSTVPTSWLTIRNSVREQT